MTDLPHVNEYEYEEKDERYGPAEREREVLFNTQVTVQLFVREPLLFVYSLLYNGFICFLSLGFTRERTKGRTGILWSGEKYTQWFKKMWDSSEKIKTAASFNKLKEAAFVYVCVFCMWVKIYCLQTKWCR